MEGRGQGLWENKAERKPAARSGCPPIEAGAQAGGRLEGSVVDPGVSPGLSPWVSCWQGRSEETSLPLAVLSHFLPPLWSWNFQVRLGLTGKQFQANS